MFVEYKRKLGHKVTRLNCKFTYIRVFSSGHYNGNGNNNNNFKLKCQACWKRSLACKTILLYCVAVSVVHSQKPFICMHKIIRKDCRERERDRVKQEQVQITEQQ